MRRRMMQSGEGGYDFRPVYAIQASTRHIFEIPIGDKWAEDFRIEAGTILITGSAYYLLGFGGTVAYARPTIRFGVRAFSGNNVIWESPIGFTGYKNYTNPLHIEFTYNSYKVLNGDGTIQDEKTGSPTYDLSSLKSTLNLGAQYDSLNDIYRHIKVFNNGRYILDLVAAEKDGVYGLGDFISGGFHAPTFGTFVEVVE